jgi:hypothetical protein
MCVTARVTDKPVNKGYKARFDDGQLSAELRMQGGQDACGSTTSADEGIGKT